MGGESRFPGGMVLATEPAREERRLKIPLTTLSETALGGIIEAFVLREGTDYGHEEHDLIEKCQMVRRQLEAGEAEIDFDPETQSVDIRPVDAQAVGGHRQQRTTGSEAETDRNR